MGLSLQEAIKSGRRHRYLMCSGHYSDWHYAGCYYSSEQVCRTDWELEPLPKKKKTVWIAVEPKGYDFDSRFASKAYSTKEMVESRYPWPVYPLEIECDE